MSDLFTSDFFAGNRARLQAETGSELIVVSANGLVQRSADEPFPFRQDNGFWYLTGINEPDMLLVINGTGTFLIEPKNSDYRDRSEGVTERSVLKAVSGIDEIFEHHEGWNRLDKLLKKYKKVHTLMPAEEYVEIFGFYVNPARHTLLSELKKHRKLEIVDIRKTVARLRQIKQAPELAAIREAIAITQKGLQKVQKKLLTYKNERELSADLIGEFIRRGADGHAFPPVVASGKNAVTIHYRDNNQALTVNEFIVVDTGAEWNNYCADIARTIAYGKPSKRHLQVYKAVERVQAAAYKLLKPGVDMKKYEAQVDRIMAHELKKLGLLDDVNDRKKLKKYYSHLTSHFLGLDTHDAADYTMPLAPGMVLTVEPGIYIPEEGIGVRIEDDVLVTETGIEILTADVLPDGE